MSALVCIKHFNDIREAQISLNFLKSQNVEADIFASGLTSYTGFEFPSQARLMVQEKDKEKALALLSEAQEGFLKKHPSKKISFADKAFISLLFALSIFVAYFFGYLGFFFFVAAIYFLGKKEPR